MNIKLKDKIDEAIKLINNSQHIVAFTGAGISVESGIPPFRGEDGLWNKYDPKILDLNFFYSNPKESWKYIREIFYDFFGKASPNKAHKVLGEMEKDGYIKGVITQNIDNLHQEGGSKNVYEFHGTASRLICTECGKIFNSNRIRLEKIPVQCEKCGGLVKPDFIFFGEGIPNRAYKYSIEATQKADLFLIIGTTGEIIPASNIPIMANQNGAKIIEINIKPSNFTNKITDIFLKGRASEVMDVLWTRLKKIEN